jgi:general secretion pathway protein F
MAMRGEPDSGRLTPDETAQLSAQLAGLTRANLPLPSGLRALGAELAGGRLRRVIEALAGSLEQGASLEAAIAAQGGAVPDYLRGLVEAGARSGRTGEVLGRFAGYAQIDVDVRRQLTLRLAYPVITLVAAISLLLFTLTYLIGGFEKVFRDFGIALPWLTEALIKTSDVLKSSGLPLLTVLAVAVAVVFIFLLGMGPAQRRSLLRYLPLFGPVWRWTSLAEFSHLLGLLVASDVPLVEAIPMAGAGVPDAALQATARRMARDVEHGDSLARAINRPLLFPEGLAAIVSWAEDQNTLPATLHMLGEMFEGRARSQARFASTVCAVLCLIVILGGIALVIQGVFAPMYQMIQKLSG